MIHSLNLDNFYLTEEQLENSPSRQDGIDRDTEVKLRMYGCELVQEAGILLSFHQVVMATGQVLLHRFYCKRSMKAFNIKKAAATALWVAAKLEEVREVREHPRKLLEMVMVAVDRCITRRETADGRKLPVLDLHSKEGEEFRRSLIRYESEMLKAFGFIMNVEHPHRLLCNFCGVLFYPYTKDMPDKWDFQVNFIQEAWNVANDSLRTMLCVRFKGSVVACGIMFYTARKLQVALPHNWWDLFQVQLEDICEVCRALHELYLAPKPTFIPVCHQLLPSKPPTPAIAAGAAAAKGLAVTATPTPMLGATPELNMRPGGKPLDPSVRRTLPANESTPNLAAAQVDGVQNGGATVLPIQSPDAAAPGSARKRSRSRSPKVSPDDSRKRQALGSKQAGSAPSASQAELQLQQQAREAMAAASAAAGRQAAAGGRDKARDRDGDRGRDMDRPRQRSRSRDRDRDGVRRPEREPDRGVYRDRPHSQDRSRSRRSRSRSRDRSKRSRSRSRDRSRRSRSRGRRSRSRSRSRDRRRDRERERDRTRDRADASRSAKGREQASPGGTDKQQQHRQPTQQEFKFPSPPATVPGHSPSRMSQQAIAPSPPKQPSAPAGQQKSFHNMSGGAASIRPVGAASGGGSSTQPKEQRSGATNGAAGGDVQQGSSKGEMQAADRAGLPPVQPKPKPVAVRKKQQSAAGVTSPVTSPTAQPHQSRSPAASQDAGGKAT